MPFHTHDTQLAAAFTVWPSIGFNAMTQKKLLQVTLDKDRRNERIIGPDRQAAGPRGSRCVLPASYL